MGKITIKRNEKPLVTETGDITVTGTETAGTGISATGSGNSKHSTAESTRTGSSGTGSSGNTGKTEKEKPVKVSLVNGDLKEEKPKTAKKKTTRKKKQTVDSNSIGMIISSASGVISSRKGFEIWALDENEVKSLSDPIANMLEKSGLLEKVGEHSDGIALTMAVVGIVGARLPFLMAQAQEKKKKQAEQRQVLKNARKVEQRIEVAEHKDNSGKADKSNADNVSNYDKNSIENLYAVIG